MKLSVFLVIFAILFAASIDAQAIGEQPGKGGNSQDISGGVGTQGGSSQGQGKGGGGGSNSNMRGQSAGSGGGH